MITYLTISLITLCFCRITYLWVRHKRENKREVALADELIEDENGIIVTRRNYQDYIQTVRRRDSLHPFFQTSTHNVFPDEVRSKTDKLSPKKDIKSHTLVERKYTIRRPGVYTGGVDVSYYNDFRNWRRENE